MSEDNDLETLLAKVSNPLIKQFDPIEFQQFCVLVEKEPDGPQTTLKFLAHKLQSPQEKEALQALKVLEETVNRCGSKFHSEVGKFRFLNELIKIVSPKYLGNRVSPQLKEKTIELLYRWSLELKKEPKVFEAYQMLKKQGIVVLDPVHVIKNQPPVPPPSPRPKNDIIEDEQTSKLLQRLLRSKNAEDLQAANRLIKSMVKEADRKMELKERKTSEIEAVHNNAKVLSDMLASYRPNTTSSEEKELMKELYESCKRLRPQIFELVSELDEKDDAINELLVANDKLTAVIHAYQQAIEQPSLLEIGDGWRPGQATAVSTPPMPMRRKTSSSASSLLDEQLLALGLDDSFAGEGGAPSSALPSQSLPNPKASSDLADLNQIFSTQSFSLTNQEPLLKPTNTPPLVNKFSKPSSTPLSSLFSQQAPSATTSVPTTTKSSALDDLDSLSQSLLMQSLPSNQTRPVFPNTPQKIPLNQLQQQQQQQQQQQSTLLDVQCTPPQPSPLSTLDGLFVPLETIQPGTIPPRTLYEHNGLKVVVHFGRDSPRPGVTVLVLSATNFSLEPITAFSFHTAVPKSMKVKFQAPSATDLPAHNPILPPAAITQVILLLNPNKEEKVRLRYKLSYQQGSQSFSHTGDVDNLMAPTS